MPPWAWLIFITASVMNFILLLVLITIFSGTRAHISSPARPVEYSSLDILMGQLTVIQTFMTAFGVAIAILGLLTFLNIRRLASDAARDTVMELSALLKPATDDPVQSPDLSGLNAANVSRRPVEQEGGDGK